MLCQLVPNYYLIIHVDIQSRFLLSLSTGLSQLTALAENSYFFVSFPALWNRLVFLYDLVTEEYKSTWIYSIAGQIPTEWK